MTGKRSSLLFTLGIVAGIVLTLGTGWALFAWAPPTREALADIAARMLRTEAPNTAGQLGPAEYLMHHLLTSEQGKAELRELVKTYADEALDWLSDEVLASRENRAKLSDFFTKFLLTDEGRELVQRIIQQIREE